MASSSNPAFSNPAFQEQRPGLTPPAAQTQFAATTAQSVDVAAQAQVQQAQLAAARALGLQVEVVPKWSHSVTIVKLAREGFDALAASPPR